MYYNEIMSEAMPEFPAEFIEEMSRLESQLTIGGLMDLLVSRPAELKAFLEANNQIHNE